MFEVKSDPRLAEKMDEYPEQVRPLLNKLREIILAVAEADETISQIEETLKWGEPSFITKNGSTIRFDWKIKNPSQYAIYFKCTSKLVPTFKVVYGDLFKYENKRAILFDLHDSLPLTELKECIRMALNYHNLKQLPLLGAAK